MLGNATSDFLIKVAQTHSIKDLLLEYTSEQKATFAVKIQSLLIDILEADSPSDNDIRYV